MMSSTYFKCLAIVVTENVCAPGANAGSKSDLKSLPNLSADFSFMIKTVLIFKNLKN